MKHFSRLIAALLVLSLAARGHAQPSPVLERWLQENKISYDFQEKMLLEKVKGKTGGYHDGAGARGGVLHPTRESLGFGIRLLKTGEPQLIAEGQAVLRRVLALQDKNSQSRTYGLWSYYLEDDMTRMARPDYNWADFNGDALLRVYRDHAAILAPDLLEQVKTATILAARSIQRRNVGLDYTNIAALGTAVTLGTAEAFDIPDLLAYATDRLQRFHAYTMRHDDFSEFNSPSYQPVTLGALDSLRKHTRHEASRPLIEDLYGRAWKGLAEHYHAPSGQWAGPHSRSYSNLLGAREREKWLTRSQTNGLPELLPLFEAPQTPREVVARVHEPSAKPDARVNRGDQSGVLPVVGTTYLAPRFALGSLSVADFWDQRRAVMAHWGTVEKPSYLWPRVLRDGRDIPAAVFFGAQKGGDVLGGVTFAVNGGEQHPHLPLKNGTFRAKDLRLRFEFGGAAKSAAITPPINVSDAISVRLDGVNLSLQVPFAAWDDHQPRWEISGDSSRKWLDLVLFEGQSQEWDLAGLQGAALGFGLRLSPNAAAPPPVMANLQDGLLALRWGELKVNVLAKPATVDMLHRAVKAAS